MRGTSMRGASMREASMREASMREASVREAMAHPEQPDRSVDSSPRIAANPVRWPGFERACGSYHRTAPAPSASVA
jgi:hypothetical protein